MPASPFDSRIYGGLLTDPEAARLFTDSAEVRAMLLVLGALAEAQGAVGLIPETAARAISRAAREAEVDPAALSDGAAASAVPVPALIDAFRAEIGAPDHAAYVHWGTTSQDLMDSGLALRLKRALEVTEERLRAVLSALRLQATTHADTVMAARTYGQAAVPTTFGAVCAGWGWPLLTALERLPAVRAEALRVSVGGAAGTLSVMGEHGPVIRSGVAERLGLVDPGRAAHADRAGIVALSAWATRVTGAVGKMGEDLLFLAASGVNEVALGSSGGSSTMPQKANPVAPSVMVALARTQVALDAGLQGAVIHRQQRDASAWMVEWLLLPQSILGLIRALSLGAEVARGMEPDAARMAALAGDDLRLTDAEALCFALAARMPRPDAQAEVKRLIGLAREEGVPLPEVARSRHPGLDFEGTSTGQAPHEARAFAKAVEALGKT